MRLLITAVVSMFFLMGTGRTSFAQGLGPEVTTPIPWTAAAGPWHFGTADVDQSGFLDVLWWDGISILYQADPGAGGGWNPGPLIPLFTAPVLNPVSSTIPTQPVDFTGDGILDLLTVSTVIYLFPGLPGGGFGPAQNLLTMTPGAGGTLAFGDFDGDGAQDIVVDRSGLPFQFGGPPPIEVWLNQGTNFVLARSELASVGSRTHIADFDQDGNDDMVYRDPTGLYRLLRGNATGALAPSTLLPANLSPLSLIRGVEDLDGDSYPDLLGAEYTPGPYGRIQRLMLIQGSPTTGLTLGPQQNLPLPVNQIGFLGMYLGKDYDGDGRTDFLTTNGGMSNSAANPVGIFLQRFDALGALSNSVQLRSFPYGGAVFLAEDFDSDGDTDLVSIVSDLSGQFYTYNEGLGIYGSACSGTTGAPLFTMGAALSGNANYTVGLTNARPNSLAALFVSVQPSTTLGCGPLIDFSATSLIGPQGVFGTFVTDAQGQVTLPIPLPVVLAAVAPLYAQWAIQDPNGAFTLGTQNLATTAARLIRIF